jgi:hypothetical protein
MTLANEIYNVLRPLAGSAKKTIGYSELIGKLPVEYHSLMPDGQMLANALGQIVFACQKNGLAALSAIVVRQQDPDKGVPGNAYYDIAHPQHKGDRPTQLIDWHAEFTKVHATKYPTTMAGL